MKNLRRNRANQKGYYLHSTPFNFVIQFLPFPLARCHKNIDFTGFFFVFLSQQGIIMELIYFATLNSVC